MNSFGEGTHCSQMQAFVILLRMSVAFAFFPDSSFSLVDILTLSPGKPSSTKTFSLVPH